MWQQETAESKLVCGLVLCQQESFAQVLLWHRLWNKETVFFLSSAAYIQNAGHIRDFHQALSWAPPSVTRRRRWELFFSFRGLNCISLIDLAYKKTLLHDKATLHTDHTILPANHLISEKKTSRNDALFFPAPLPAQVDAGRAGRPPGSPRRKLQTHSAHQREADKDQHHGQGRGGEGQLTSTLFLQMPKIMLSLFFCKKHPNDRYVYI